MFFNASIADILYVLDLRVCLQRHQGSLGLGVCKLHVPGSRGSRRRWRRVVEGGLLTPL